ncbi:unnamed protein product [Prorocentrum cordatum]|uniref:Uncharacterized protein n=1 Tax=Prorocentrum cordatum TaxID=2364126 RepID=A0ABN9Y6L5_9DINO|nr:unnamed protein product [Polarella glacialis]
MCVCVPSPLVSEVHAAEKKRECSRRLDAVAPKPSVASAGQGRELGRPERAEKTCCRAGRRVEALPSWAECEPALSRQRTHHPTACHGTGGIQGMTAEEEVRSVCNSWAATPNVPTKKKALL